MAGKPQRGNLSSDGGCSPAADPSRITGNEKAGTRGLSPVVETGDKAALPGAPVMQAAERKAGMDLGDYPFMDQKDTGLGGFMATADRPAQAPQASIALCGDPGRSPDHTAARTAKLAQPGHALAQTAEDPVGAAGAVVAGGTARSD